MSLGEFSTEGSNNHGESKRIHPDRRLEKEKHAPIIECPERVKAGEVFEVTVGLGKEIAHPNTTEQAEL